MGQVTWICKILDQVTWSAQFAQGQITWFLEFEGQVTWFRKIVDQVTWETKCEDARLPRPQALKLYWASAYERGVGDCEKGTAQRQHDGE